MQVDDPAAGDQSRLETADATAEELAVIIPETAYVLTQSTGTHTPAAPWTYNAKGGTNTVERVAKGSYRVTLGKITKARATVMVNVYGDTSGRCTVGGWSASSSSAIVTVYCTNYSGARVDARFTLFYSSDYGEPRMQDNAAFAFSQSLTGNQLPVNGTWSANRYGAINITREAKGTYDVQFKGFPSRPALAALVTAYGSGANWCTVDSRYRSGSDEHVLVECWDPTFDAVDSQFTVLLVGGSLGTYLGTSYVWGGDYDSIGLRSTPIGPDDPPTDQCCSWASQGSSPSISRQSVEDPYCRIDLGSYTCTDKDWWSYRVTSPGFSVRLPLVTAYSSGTLGDGNPRYCNPNYAMNDGTRFAVVCWINHTTHNLSTFYGLAIGPR